MKTIYILLTRSGTLLSNLVYRLTGANYTHASLCLLMEDLSCLYRSPPARTATPCSPQAPAGVPGTGVFRLRPEAPPAPLRPE